MSGGTRTCSEVVRSISESVGEVCIVAVIGTRGGDGHCKMRVIAQSVHYRGDAVRTLHGHSECLGRGGNILIRGYAVSRVAHFEYFRPLCGEGDRMVDEERLATGIYIRFLVAVDGDFPTVKAVVVLAQRRQNELVAQSRGSRLGAGLYGAARYFRPRQSHRRACRLAGGGVVGCIVRAGFSVELDVVNAEVRDTVAACSWCGY